MPRGKAKNPKTDRRRFVKKSKVSDADIVIELVRNGGMTSAADAALGVRKGRSAAVSAKYGGIAEIQKRETSLLAADEAVKSLFAVLEQVRMGHEPDTIKAVAIAVGIAVEKLLLLAGKPNIFARIDTNNETTVKTVDLTDLVNKLSRAELEQLMILRDKVSGIQEPEELSDIDNPVNYDDATYTPPPQPGLNQ